MNAKANRWMATLAATLLVFALAANVAEAALNKAGDIVAKENLTNYPDNGDDTLGQVLNGYNPANDGTNQIGWTGAWSGSDGFIADTELWKGSWSDPGSGPSGPPTAWYSHTTDSGSVGRNMTTGVGGPSASFAYVEFWMTVYMRNWGYGGVPGSTLVTDNSGNTLFGIERPANQDWRIIARDGSGSTIYSTQVAANPNSFGEYVIRGVWTNAGAELYLWARPDGADGLTTFDTSLTTTADGLALSADVRRLVLYTPGPGDGRAFLWDDFELRSFSIVPEPAGAVLLAFGALALLRRRRNAAS